MNADETLRLLDAGFTAEEIRTMEKEGTENPEGSANPEKEPGSAEPESAVNASKEIEALTAEVTKLTETVKMLQEVNIKNAGTGSAPSAATDPVNKAINNFLQEL